MRIFPLLSAIAIAVSFLPAQQQSTPSDIASLLPPTTVACIDWRSGECLVAAVRAFAEARQPLPPRLRAIVGLAPGLLRGLTGGFGPEELAEVISPDAAALALVAVDGNVRPLLVARMDPRSPDLDRLLDRLSGSFAGSVEDGVLAIARTPDDVLRYHRWRRDAEGRTLADRTGFSVSRPELEDGASVRLFVDVAALRARRDGRSAFERLDPGGRFLLGPLAVVLDRATRLDGLLHVGVDDVAFEAHLDATVLGTEPAGALLAGGADDRELPPPPEGVLATLALDRSVKGLFGHLDEVLGQAVAVQAKSGLSIANALLGGSVVDDLLPALGEPPTLFAVRRDVDTGDGPQPALDLPSLVAVVPLADVGAATEQLVHLFRTTLTVNTIERRRRGQVAFLLRIRRTPDGEKLWVAEPEDWRGPLPIPTALGLSPTLGFGHGHAVIATTRDGAERALRALGSERPGERARGDVLTLEPAAGADYVTRNIASLTLGKVLDEGVSVVAARNELEGFRELLSVFARAEVAVRPEVDATTWTVRLRGGG